jgi:hypothetical protein
VRLGKVFFFVINFDELFSTRGVVFSLYIYKKIGFKNK